MCRIELTPPEPSRVIAFIDLDIRADHVRCETQARLAVNASANAVRSVDNSILAAPLLSLSSVKIGNINNHSRSYAEYQRNEGENCKYEFIYLSARKSI